MNDIVLTSRQQTIALRKKIITSVKGIYDSHAILIATCGTGKDEPPDINESTGLWLDEGIHSKAPRYLIHLIPKHGKVEARKFENRYSSRIGYYNVARKVLGGIFAIIVPAVQMSDGTFQIVKDWEWLIFLEFKKPITGGNSSESFDGFNLPTPSLIFQGQPVEVNKVVLFGLCNQDSGHPKQNPAITYAEATNAIAHLFGIQYK